uniref:Target of myb1 like 2 membrane trafficking protein n=1 Tax=Salarias fasciatus TaxID=181472 RepID=A0A672H2T4_SALFA
MEFLLGNPYSTPVGHCIERATDGSLQSEDWTLNMEICDIINETEDGPKDAIRAVKKRVNGNRNYREVMLALTICRLRSELDVVRGNTKVMSEMLTEMVPGQEDASDYELLQELNRTCRAMQQRIMELISCVSNEAVTEELLHANDDLNNIFLRYDRYERFRSGRSSAQSVNNGVLSEATEDNLIDLGPGSPAVVSNMPNAAPSSLPPGLTAPAGRPSSPGSLASRLAGLDVGGDSVSSTLSSLSSCKPPPTQDDFDVFAQTRTGAAEAGAPPTLDVKQQPAPAGVSPGNMASSAGCAVACLTMHSLITHTHTHTHTPSVSSWFPLLSCIYRLFTSCFLLSARRRSSQRAARQPSVMDDIEEWLATDVKGDEGEEGVTSEEFDKFLEERAKAAEVTPGLPAPPSGAPGAAPGTPGRKKAGRAEDALFAM